MRYRFAFALLVLLSACESPPIGLGCGEETPFPELSWSHPSAGVVPGASRDLFVELETDCLNGVELTLTPSETGIVEIPSSVSTTAGTSRANVQITGVDEGTVTITATATHPSGDTVSADIEIVVMSPSVPGCSGSASEMVSPGGSVDGTLVGATLELPLGAARDDAYHVDGFAASIDCSNNIVPAGYSALGPAVTFGPEHLRFRRELRVTIPIYLALLPSGANRGHVELAYKGPHDAASRVIAITSPRFTGSAGGGELGFEVARLGTYQAIVSDDVPSTRTREFTFRGILGFSMGGSGSGRIGMGNPELFDFVAPLGGPTDWTYMLEYIRRYHLGGFCTEPERLADPAACAASSLDRTPPVTQLHEHPQHFEHWWYEDGYEGQGGTFDRQDDIYIFRDLAAMYGNPNTDASADPMAPNIAPPGVPESMRTLPDDQRCLPENQIRIATGFYDDEFNPDGSHQVITFCDGGETGDVGQWDPAATQDVPLEVALAVDLDADGIRDPGEPLIRNGREPFDDFGLDRVRNELEVSFDGTLYDPVTNPDPSGDDFDFLYNPRGTENNWARDTIDDDPCRAAADGMAESFEDIGIDGVASTPQLAAGGYDSGEGNGCFDRARGATRMIESSPRWLAEHMDEAVLRDVDVFADGGIRDLFNWAVMGNVSMAGWSSRGHPVRYYNTHSTLHLDERPLDGFETLRVPWDEIGKNVMVRYGHPDTPENFVRAGDGGHVGTITQLTDRLRAALAMMSARWPEGDRGRVADRICTVNDSCEYINSFVFQFTASTGREGPVSVVLPPGYFLPENTERTYPVVYFLHGYGMTPEDLVALGLFLWEAMNTPRVGTERRMAKMILVFPDGRCRNGECLRGTFYTDAPESTPNGARMQTFLLDLIEHIDATYRTRSPGRYEVME